MFKDLAQFLKVTFPEYEFLPYLKNVESVPHEAKAFMSLYLLRTSYDFSGKKLSTYQVLLAIRTQFSEDEVEWMEKETERVLKLLRKYFPVIRGEADYGVSDTFVYAYLKLEVRHK